MMVNQPDHIRRLIKFRRIFVQRPRDLRHAGTLQVIAKLVDEAHSPGI